MSAGWGVSVHSEDVFLLGWRVFVPWVRGFRYFSRRFYPGDGRLCRQVKVSTMRRATIGEAYFGQIISE